MSKVVPARSTYFRYIYDFIILPSEKKLFPSLHRFPEDAEKRKTWIWMIDIHINQKIDWNESMKICALHFGDVCFTAPDQLTDNANPSLLTKNAVALRKSELYVLPLVRIFIDLF